MHDTTTNHATNHTDAIEQAWDDAVQHGPNRNARLLNGTLLLIRDGSWILALDQNRRHAKWWAYNLTTGERVQTGCAVMTDVNRFLYERHAAQGGNQGITVESGPQRSRAGNQRYTAALTERDA